MPKNISSTDTRGPLLAAAILASAAGAVAGDTLGQFESWHAQAFDEPAGKVCSLWSQPEKSEGKYARRGEVFIFITHAPATSSFDRVSLEIGYTFKESSEVRVSIGKRAFKLSSGGSAAWADSAKEDKRMVQAMRGGRSMVVEGISSRGTQTRDTFSLYGFSAAHDAIGKACKR